MTVTKSRGYQQAQKRKFNELDDLGIGKMQLDASFSPVEFVTYNVETARVKQRTDLDKLVIDLKSNATIEPEDAIRKADHIIDSLDAKIYSHYKAGIRHFTVMDQIRIEVNSGKNYDHLIKRSSKLLFNINYFSSSE